MYLEIRKRSYKKNIYDFIFGFSTRYYARQPSVYP